MITLWTDWFDEWRAKAIVADPMLSDREALVEAIYRERHAKEQLARRIATAAGATGRCGIIYGASRKSTPPSDIP